MACPFKVDPATYDKTCPCCSKPPTCHICKNRPEPKPGDRVWVWIPNSELKGEQGLEQSLTGGQPSSSSSSKGKGWKGKDKGDDKGSKGFKGKEEGYDKGKGGKKPGLEQSQKGKERPRTKGKRVLSSKALWPPGLKYSL